VKMTATLDQQDEIYMLEKFFKEQLLDHMVLRGRKKYC